MFIDVEAVEPYMVIYLAKIINTYAVKIIDYEFALIALTI